MSNDFTRLSKTIAHEQGMRFYPGNQMVWLAEPIPSRFIAEQ
jgi:RNA:NAD 2'-phosphotransferase (TPT1/KptA family)